MSIVRFGQDGSDMYIYEDIYDGLKCCGCLLKKPFGSEDFGEDKNALLLHIKQHIEAGHYAPSWLMQAVREYE